MGRVRITVDNRLALTVEQAAERYGLKPSSVRAIISRAQIPPAGLLDRQKKLYGAAELDAAVKGRPGKGSNLRRSSDRTT